MERKRGICEKDRHEQRLLEPLNNKAGKDWLDALNKKAQKHLHPQ